ncbi:MAG: hypothetical protein K6T31_01410 [Alicyclobacillus sp.]|nr:hypothetical protein [Alicyclobacillus sp.]
MRIQWLTPHQAEATRPLYDTVLAAVPTPLPLDLAVPWGASIWIGQQLQNRLGERLQGRTSQLPLGSSLQTPWADPALWAGMAEVWPHPVHWVVVITDRVLVAPTWAFSCDTTTPGGDVHVLVFDWW